MVALGFTLTCSVFNTGGIRIDGEQVNLVGGRMTGCTRVFVAGSGRHRIVNMTVEGARRGFGVSSTNNLLVGNAALNNEAEGFEVFSDGNKLVGNRAENNGEEGISLSGRNNILIRNKALNNNAFDLEDSNFNCDNNQWVNNIFNTSNQDCIE